MRRRAAKASFAFADQAASSLTNVIGNIGVASTATVEAYGAFGVSIAVLLTVSSVVSGLIVEPLLVRHRTEPASASRAAWYCGVSGLPILVVGAVMHRRIGPTAIPVLVTMPFLLGFHGFRFFLLGTSRAKDALLLDMVWLAATAAGMSALVAAGKYGPVLGAWVYALSGCLALAVGGIRHRLLSPELRIVAFVIEERRIAIPWGLEHLAAMGIGQGLTFLIVSAYGLSGAAAYRGGMTILGPVTVIAGGMRFAALPYFLDAGRRGVVGRSVKMSFAFFAVWLILGSPLLLTPDGLGTQLLGDSWEGVRLLLPYLLLYRAMSSGWGGPALGLRIAEAGASSLLLRVATVVSLLAAGGFAIALGASLHIMVSVLVVTSLAVVPFWFRRLLQEVT